MKVFSVVWQNCNYDKQFSKLPEQNRAETNIMKNFPAKSKNIFYNTSLDLFFIKMTLIYWRQSRRQMTNKGKKFQNVPAKSGTGTDQR